MKYTSNNGRSIWKYFDNVNFFLWLTSLRYIRYIRYPQFLSFSTYTDVLVPSRSSSFTPKETRNVLNPSSFPHFSISSSVSFVDLGFVPVRVTPVTRSRPPLLGTPRLPSVHLTFLYSLFRIWPDPCNKVSPTQIFPHSACDPTCPFVQRSVTVSTSRPSLQDLTARLHTSGVHTPLTVRCTQ